MMTKALMIGIALVAAALAMSSPTRAAPPDVPSDEVAQRLELFSRAQRSCAFLVLSNPEKGRALAALKKPLHEFCECVAVYAVSQTTDAAMKAIMTDDADPEQTAFFVDQQLKAFGICSI